MASPPAIVQPAVSGVKQTQSAVRPSASFGRQGAGARPMTASPTVTRSMSSPSFMNTSKLATPVKAAADAGSKAVNVASKVAPLASRVAGLASRVNPIATAAMTGAAASQALGKLATGTETGRAIGKSIGRALNPPVSTLPKSEPSTPAAAPKPSTVNINKGDTMTSIAKANKTTVDDLAKANPDIKDVNKISAGKSLNLPNSSYTPKPVDQADTVKQSGGEPSVQTGTQAPKAAPMPPASSERPSAPPMQNPDQNITKEIPTIAAPSEPAKVAPKGKNLGESVEIGDYKYRIV